MSDESQEQTTTLHIVIGGLCLLVRDEDRSDRKKLLHVLLPKGKHAHCHSARLMYREVYGCAGPKPNGICDHSLDEVVFDLSGQVGGIITGPMKIGGVADETCMQSRPVERKLLDGDKLDKALKARITIPAGREGAGTNVGSLWELGDCLHYMATLVHWEIPGLPADKVILRYKQNGSVQTLELTPSDGEIVLFILHEMEKSLPRSSQDLTEIPTPAEPDDEYEATHFTDIYPLVGKSENDKAPKHKGKPGRQKAKAFKPFGRLGFDFTCIAATAPAAPKS